MWDWMFEGARCHNEEAAFSNSAGSSRARSSRPSLMTDNHLYPHQRSQRPRTARRDTQEVSLVQESRPQIIRVAEDDLKMVRDVLDSLKDVDDYEERRHNDDEPYIFEDLIPEIENVHVSLGATGGHPGGTRTASASFSSIKPTVAGQTGLQSRTRNAATVSSTGSNIEAQPLTFETTAEDSKIKNTTLQAEFKQRQKSTAYRLMQLYRQRLPVWKMRETILDKIAKHQVVVICGDTGCGKTTQVPQFILDEALEETSFNIHVVCTQPRRIAAISVAQRVAKERDEQLGRCVGFKMRFESAMSPYTRLLYCTTGIILRQLENDPELRQNRFTHIIIDEVHERSADSDFLLMNLRLLLKSRPDLRVILMSATINAELFSEFFGGCPVLEIPGQTFEVRQYYLEDAFRLTHVGSLEAGCNLMSSVVRYRTSRTPRHNHRNAKRGRIVSDKDEDKDLNELELKQRYPGCSADVIRALSAVDPEEIDYDLIVKLVIWIARFQQKEPEKGAVLIFMPGFSEIEALYGMLDKNSELKRLTELQLVPLHSSLSTEEQNEAFLKCVNDVTKIVIATNIAETSITINDIVFVIDSGLMKENRYDHRKHMNSLDTVSVSKANAIQRKGRAGRVRSGVCFHLFTSHRYRHHLQDQPMPEIQRISLDQLILRVKMMSIFKHKPVEDVLGKLLEPPSQEAIDSAITRLADLGALDENEELTALGYYVAMLPVDVRIGKLMLFGAIFRCLDPALTIAAMFSYKTPFISPFDPAKRQEARERKMEFAGGKSDFLTLLNAYKGWYEAKMEGYQSAKQYCHENFLSIRTLQMLTTHKQQFVVLLSEIGFIQTGIRVRDLQKTANMASDGVTRLTGIENAEKETSLSSSSSCAVPISICGHGSPSNTMNRVMDQMCVPVSFMPCRHAIQANENSDNWELISAVLLAALYPNVAQVPADSGIDYLSLLVAKLDKEPKFNTRDGWAQIHPSSVNFKVTTFSHPFIMYHEKVKTKRVYIRDCSEVSALALLLFGGGRLTVESHGSYEMILMDKNWIKLRASSKTAKILMALRKELNQLLSIKMKNPETDLVSSPRGSRVIRCIVDLISADS